MPDGKSEIDPSMLETQIQSLQKSGKSPNLPEMEMLEDHPIPFLGLFLLGLDIWLDFAHLKRPFKKAPCFVHEKTSSTQRKLGSPTSQPKGDMVVCGQEIWKFWQQKSPQVDISAWIFTHPMVVDSLDPNMGLVCKKNCPT